MINLLYVSGIPFGSVNLLDGVDENESKVKSLCTFLRFKIEVSKF